MSDSIQMSDSILEAAIHYNHCFDNRAARRGIAYAVAWVQGLSGNSFEYRVTEAPFADTFYEEVGIFDSPEEAQAVADASKARHVDISKQISFS